jgi:hypothetical protein
MASYLVKIDDWSDGWYGIEAKNPRAAAMDLAENIGAEIDQIVIVVDATPLKQYRVETNLVEI